MNKQKKIPFKKISKKSLTRVLLFPHIQILNVKSEQCLKLSKYYVRLTRAAGSHRSKAIKRQLVRISRYHDNDKHEVESAFCEVSTRPSQKLTRFT